MKYYIINFQMLYYRYCLSYLRVYAKQKICKEPHFIGGFHRIPSTNKTECHDRTEILLKVAFNTITPTKIYLSILIPKECVLSINQQ